MGGQPRRCRCRCCFAPASIGLIFTKAAHRGGRLIAAWLRTCRKEDLSASIWAHRLPPRHWAPSRRRDRRRRTPTEARRRPEPAPGEGTTGSRPFSTAPNRGRRTCRRESKPGSSSAAGRATRTTPQKTTAHARPTMAHSQSRTARIGRSVHAIRTTLPRAGPAGPPRPALASRDCRRSVRPYRAASGGIDGGSPRGTWCARSARTWRGRRA